VSISPDRIGPTDVTVIPARRVTSRGLTNA